MSAKTPAETTYHGSPNSLPQLVDMKIREAAANLEDDTAAVRIVAMVAERDFWKGLCGKYRDHVENCEGVDLIDHINDGWADSVSFTAEELSALYGLRDALGRYGRECFTSDEWTALKELTNSDRPDEHDERDDWQREVAFLDGE